MDSASLSVAIDLIGLIGAAVALPTAMFVFSRHRFLVQVACIRGSSIRNKGGDISVLLVNHGRSIAIRSVGIEFRGAKMPRNRIEPQSFTFDPEPPCVIDSERRLEAELPLHFEDAAECKWRVYIELENTCRLEILPDNAEYGRTVFFRPAILGVLGPIRPRTGIAWKLSSWIRGRQINRWIREQRRKTS